jgi:hypothetical protein
MTAPSQSPFATRWRQMLDALSAAEVLNVCNADLGHPPLNRRGARLLNYLRNRAQRQAALTGEPT